MKQNLTPRINRLESNIIIDGGMEIWPEGTSRSVANNTAAYGSVLFRTLNTSTGVTLTNSQQASVPSGTSIPFSNQLSKTAAGTLAAGTISMLSYYVEGYDVSRIFNTEFSVIFWVKSSVASNRSVALNNNGSTHSYVQQYNISAANSWEMKAVKFPALNTCPGTINRTNSIGAEIRFGIVNGSTFQTSTLNAWQAGNFISGIGEDTTWLTGTTHDFNIAGVMILPGDWTALTSSGYSFLRASRTFQQELAITQRYYEKSFELNTAPAQGAGITGAYHLSIGAAGNWGAVVDYKSVKRAIPTIVTYNTSAANANWRDNNNSVDRTAQITSSGSGSFGIIGLSFAASTTNTIHWTADARF